MKITFLSNLYNPHVSPFCESLAKTPGIDFSFIACTDPAMVSESAIANRNASLGQEPSFVFSSWKNRGEWSKCRDLVQESDVLIMGSCDYTLLPKEAQHRLLFLFSERPFKKNNLLFLRKIKLWLKMHNIDKNAAGCLCASAYAKDDFLSSRLFKGRCIKWGYFPEGNLKLDLSRKTIGDGGVLRIFWSGRMIDWKRPDLAFSAAQRLNDVGIKFHMDVAGDGPLLEKMKQDSATMGLQNEVSFRGFLSNEDNLSVMSLSDVVLFTSGREEGWGAVVNEAMSSKTVLIASRKAGSVPFLIKDGVNGFVFEEETELFDKIQRLGDRQNDNEMAAKARETIAEHWNGTVAAHNFLKQVNSLFLCGKFDTSIPSCDPGSLVK